MSITFIGIDYSFTGPAICVHTGSDSWSFDNCTLLSLTKTKKYHSTFVNGKVTMKDFAPWTTNEQRFDSISDFFMDIIERFDPSNTLVGIEDYSFASQGMQFTIGENTGILKHKIYKAGFELETFAPKAVKKFACSGNADKADMHEAFKEETGVDLVTMLEYNRKKIDSPIADLVDAYYVCKCLYNQRNNNNEN